MGGWAARKALLVVENVETVLAIEALCACQALDFLTPLTDHHTPVNGAPRSSAFCCSTL